MALFLRALALLLALGLAAPSGARAAGTCSTYRTWATGDSLTPGDLNTSFATVGQTNMIPSCMDSYSQSAGIMQTMTNPYPASVESLATTLQGELERIRYVIQNLTGWTQWYTHNGNAMTVAPQAAQTLTATWNGAGQPLRGLVMNITDTASAATASLLDLRVGGAQKWTVQKDGTLVAGFVPGNRINSSAVGAQFGGTGLNTSAATGNPIITAGTWSVPASAPIAFGGTNSVAALNNNRLMWSAAGAIVEATALTNGQFFIGSTGAAPVAAALTAGANVAVTNAAGTITVAGAEAYNYVFNSNLEIWGGGTAVAPTSWAQVGAGGTVAKNITAGQFKLGVASAAVTRAGTDTYLAHNTVTVSGPVAWWQSRTVSAGAWVRCTVASRGRISIDDGVSTTSSSLHSGGSAFEWLTVTGKVLSGSATQVQLRLEVITGNTTCQFDGATLVASAAAPSDWVESGWRGRKAILGAVVGSGSGYQVFSLGDGTYGNISISMPYKGVARNLYPLFSGVPSPNNVTLYKNGSATSMVGTTAGVPDIVNQVEYAKADTWAIRGDEINSGVLRTSFEYEEIP